MVLPAPVAPTSAIFWPGLANQVMSCSTGLSGLYPNVTSVNRTSPRSSVRRPSGEVIAFSRAFIATSAAFGLNDCAAFRERVPSSLSSRFQAQWPVSWSTSVMVRPSSPSSTLTSVTVPPSSSGFSSMSWKMREAPASAIITMLNCMETWPSGLTKERDRVSREISVPRVSVPAPENPKLPTPDSAMEPPAMASRM